MVTTFAPSRPPIGTTQDRIAVPFTWTVQAPHCAMPQPNLVPVKPITSRNTQRRGVSGSMSTCLDAPFTSIVITAATPLRFDEPTCAIKLCETSRGQLDYIQGAGQSYQCLVASVEQSVPFISVAPWFLTAFGGSRRRVDDLPWGVGRSGQGPERICGSRGLRGVWQD